MITVELERVGSQLRVRIPDHPRFLRFACLVLAKRDGDSWLFDVAHEIQVRALVRAILSARSTGLDQVAADSGALEKPPFAPAAFDVTELLDSQMDLRAQLRRAAEVAIDFDPNCMDASMLEEVSAGFESIAARLRAVASQRESA